MCLFNKNYYQKWRKWCSGKLCFLHSCFHFHVRPSSNSILNFIAFFQSVLCFFFFAWYLMSKYELVFHVVIENLNASYSWLFKLLLCVYILGALEGEARVNGEMRDVTIQRGGSCNNDNVCHNHCPGCAITRCVFNQCVCSRCNPPQQQLRDVTIQRGGSCNNDNVCHNHCPRCAITRCIFNQCVCSQCNPPYQHLRIKSHM